MVYRGKFHNGVVVFDGDVKLSEGQAVRVELDEPAPPEKAQDVWHDLLKLAGSCADLPHDMAENHDHYLYGVPKRTERQ